jgi:copper(I)-binding protein
MFSLLPMLGAAATPTTPTGHTASAPIVERAWARATPPGVSVGAVYLTIRNAGKQDDQLVTLRSPSSERAEIHETKMSNGIMQMRQITDATVPAGGTWVLEPGGRHVMLIGLKPARPRRHRAARPDLPPRR